MKAFLGFAAACMTVEWPPSEPVRCRYSNVLPIVPRCNKLHSKKIDKKLFYILYFNDIQQIRQQPQQLLFIFHLTGHQFCSYLRF